MSDNQLNFEKWTTLLEPGPKDILRKAEAETLKAAELASPAVSEVIPAAMSEDVAEDTSTQVYSVSDLNSLIKDQIENGFASVWVQGEISNFKAHTSGHFYFSLKDSKSQISAVMFKGFNGRLKFRPESGMEVVVRGRVTVYEPRGSYQVFCETMEPVGAGALQKAFEQLKAKLQKEGLFEAKHKKAIPLLPKQIGVVTSPTGAAIQDILNVLGRRYKGARITVIPARVQGDGAAAEIVRGIELANRVKSYDVLIVGRGGGSIEDMWCFNEEVVARAIFASKIPIISAVGHEIDFTIADFVADLRAPTPSAAAEIVAKSATELAERIKNNTARMVQKIQFRLSQWQMRVNHMQSQLVDPQRRLQDLSQRCDELLQRLTLSWQSYSKEQTLHIRLLREKLKNPQRLLDFKKQALLGLSKSLHKEAHGLLSFKKENLRHQMSILHSLSPLSVMQRGYSVIYRGETLLKDAIDAKPGDEIIVQMAKTALRAQVIEETTSKFKNIEEDVWTSKKN